MRVLLAGATGVIGRHRAPGRRRLQHRRRSAHPVREWLPEMATMLVEHHHSAGIFDAGRCRACADEAALLDHYHRVQRQEGALLPGDSGVGRTARRHVLVVLGSLGVAVLPAVAALLTR
jgi:hypothetical protein